MITIEPHTQLINIKGFGKCTMIPLSTLPEHLRSYERMRQTALTMGLREFPELRHNQMQEIAKSVALHFRANGSIFISGIVKAYPFIANNRIDLKPIHCVPSIELMTYDLPRIETFISYIPITSIRKVREEEIVMCLFLGGD